jgi:hypothetical protein
MSTHHHHEIPCGITIEPICRAIEVVLTRVAGRSPADLQRIRMRVQRFTSVLVSDDPRDREASGAFISKGSDFYEFDAPGEVYIAPEKPYSNALAVVAYELGHVCTRQDDFWDRDGFDGEWASEMCADFYAYRWGFGRNIGQHRRSRSFGRHGPGPGQEFTTEHDGVVRRYRVTRENFKIKFIQSETPEGAVIETAAQADVRLTAEAQARIGERNK